MHVLDQDTAMSRGSFHKTGHILSDGKIGEEGAEEKAIENIWPLTIVTAIKWLESWGQYARDGKVYTDVETKNENERLTHGHMRVCACGHMGMCL